jgi:hypothetical protein
MLQLGDDGSDVQRWQQFLVGQGLLEEADGTFGPMTHQATMAFQKAIGLKSDGLVGNKTLTVAAGIGYSTVQPVSITTLRSLSYADKQAIFGPLEFISTPKPGNPELIKITNDWSKNLQRVRIPQLSGISGAPSNQTVLFHMKGAEKLVKLWNKWEDEGLIPLILTWDGGWAPRFIRGSKSILSSHAFATAFDINARWNPLGVDPPADGVKGSVRRLVQYAEEFGFFWGGSGWSRPDGMHFELAVV